MDSSSIYTPCLKKVAHHTLRNIFAQGWPIAKILTATESEIIREHKCIINVLIFNVPKCCHLANSHVSNWQLCVHKTAHILKVSELIVICPFVAGLLIALENNSFYWSKCYYRTFDMFWAQNFSCSNKTVPCLPSQGNSCSVNDWDTWFYPAYVVASELPGPQSCWLLCLECATRTCLLLHQGWQCGRLKTAHRGWMDSSWS